MLAVVQRVKACTVQVENRIVGSIDQGMLVLVGVFSTDTEDDVTFLANKLCKIKMFSSGQEINKTIMDINGSIMVVSQFTLCADTSKGRRPSFHRAAKPIFAKNLYNKLIDLLKERGLNTETGEFGAMMNISILNEGPYTLILNSNTNYEKN